MPPTIHKKTTKIAKHIIASSLSLVDTNGKTRISMDAGDGDGYAVICMFGEDNSTIQISTSPDGGVHISLQKDGSSIALGIMTHDTGGLSIVRNGGISIIGMNEGKHAVIIKDDNTDWKTPKSKKR